MTKKIKNKTKSKQKQKQKQKQTQIVNVNIHKPSRKTIYKRKEKTDISNIQQLPTPQYIYTSQVDSLMPQRFNKQGGREEEDDLMSKLKQLAKQYIDDKPKDITKENVRQTRTTKFDNKPDIKINDYENPFITSLIIGKQNLKKTNVMPPKFEKHPVPQLVEEREQEQQLLDIFGIPVIEENKPPKKTGWFISEPKQRGAQISRQLKTVEEDKLYKTIWTLNDKERKKGMLDNTDKTKRIVMIKRYNELRNNRNDFDNKFLEYL